MGGCRYLTLMCTGVCAPKTVFTHLQNRLLAILQMSLDQLHIFMRNGQLDGVRASIYDYCAVHIQKFYKFYENIIGVRFSFRIKGPSLEAIPKTKVLRYNKISPFDIF